MSGSNQHSTLLDEARRLAGWAPEKPESVHDIVCVGFNQLDAMHSALQAAVELIQNERDGLFEQYEKKVEHLRQCQEKYDGLEEQYQALESAARGISDYLATVGAEETDEIHQLAARLWTVLNSNPAKRRLTPEAEQQWREMVDPYLEPDPARSPDA